MARILPILDVCARSGRCIALPVALLVLLLVVARTAGADPLKGEISTSTSGGYARLVFRMNDDVDASVRLSGNVLIISFKQPVAVAVDRLATQVPDYIGAARRDPDGKAIRLALARKVTVNSMAAAEKFFVDLLPETWTGQPPGLPQEVVEDLARRVREAERIERQQRRAAQQRKVAPVRVRVAVQPTFTRYVFGVSDQVAVSADHSKDRLTLTFDAPIKFDLADVKASLPPVIDAVDAESEEDSVLVRFTFLTKLDVRTFREDRGYVVDVIGTDAKLPPRGDTPEDVEQGTALEAPPAADAPPMVEAPATVPAQPSAPATPAPAPGKPAVTAPNPQPPPPKPAPAAAAPVPQPPPPKPAAAAAAPAPAAPAAAVEMPPVAPMAQSAPAATEVETPAQPGERPSPAPESKPPPAGGAAVPSLRLSLLEGAPRNPGSTVAVELTRHGDNVKLSFPFATRTAAAVFRRADSLWLVFDSNANIDLAALAKDTSRTIHSAELTRAPDGDIVRVRLERPRLASVAIDGPMWIVTIGDEVLEPTRALGIVRNVIGPNRSSMTIPFEEPHQLHRLSDPDIGDSLLVVTGYGPARGFLKSQDFVELRALASSHGVVVQPLADDVNAEISEDKIVVARPAGLTLSSSLAGARRTSGLRPVVFDSQLWGFDRQAVFVDRQAQLVRVAAEAPENKRTAPRVDLARFYLARDMFPEAKGVLDVVLGEDRPTAEETSAIVLRAVAEVMMNRPEAALKDLATPAVGNQHEAPLWRALAHARQGKWAEAREGFKSVGSAMATLPIELQRLALKDAARAAIEVRDFASAANHLADFETIGVPREMEPAISVLSGRLAEGMGRSEEALAAYRTAADSSDRPAAAQGRLREIALRYSLGDLKREEVISELETLTTIWRGDETEVEALQLLARLYTEEGRYRDSFYVMRSAMAAHPDSEMTRRIQEAAGATFDALFLAGKGDTMPAIDALALFYDFRELTPIGRRGDEMIRRLADRLVSVDLLDQAAELLQHQVDHRLQGAARAQVATRLAVIYLMNRKPERALATLRATRTAELTNELRNQRLLLEGRALSDVGRNDVALEVIANIEGREAIRLRSDIQWAARRWRASAEQLELLYGDRWKEFQPLNDIERADILRAAIGYALGEDKLGLSRFREKYAAKMAEGPDGRAFEIVSAPLGTSGAEFADIARSAASIDTLDGFLRDLRARFPETGAMPPPSPPAAETPAAPPAPSPPPTKTSNPEPEPAKPPARAAGRSASR